MRRLLLTTFIAFSLTLCSTTSLFAGAPIEFGFRAGLQTQSANIDLSSIESSAMDVATSRDMGYQVALMSRITLGTLYIQPELGYSAGRFEMETGSNMGVKYKVNTFEVPVLVGVKVAFLRLFAGPNFNIATSTKTEGINFSDSYNAQFYKSVAGYQAGAGVEFFGLNVDVRYVGQFSNPEQVITWSGYTTPRIETKLNTWQINVGYFF